MNYRWIVLVVLLLSVVDCKLELDDEIVDCKLELELDVELDELSLDELDYSLEYDSAFELELELDVSLLELDSGSL